MVRRRAIPQLAPLPLPPRKRPPAARPHQGVLEPQARLLHRVLLRVGEARDWYVMVINRPNR